ncbi:MAG: septum formation initiator family protein [Gammaproteobacteria bacterium]|nr:septum formation initiator family protein [Gammaproteobacteria bacterium]
MLIALVAFLQYRLWFDTDGLAEMARLKKELIVQQQTTLNLKQRNEALLLSIKQLKENTEVKEERARDELGMIKKGETFYQVVK